MSTYDPSPNYCCCAPPPPDCTDPFTYDFETANSWYIGLDVEVPSVASIGLPQRHLYLRGYLDYCVNRFHPRRCCPYYLDYSKDCSPGYHINCCAYLLPVFSYRQYGFLPPVQTRFYWSVGPGVSMAAPVVDWYKENITGGNPVIFDRISYDNFDCASETIFCCNDAVEQLFPEKNAGPGRPCTDFLDHRVGYYIAAEPYFPWTSSYIKTHSPTIPPVGGIRLPFFVVFMVYYFFLMTGNCGPHPLFPYLPQKKFFEAWFIGTALYYGVLDLPFSTSKVIQLQFLDFIIETVPPVFIHEQVPSYPVQERFPEVTRLLTDMNVKLVFESIGEVQPVVWQYVRRYIENYPYFFYFY